MSFKVKGGSFHGVARVLARSEEEEESEDGHVGTGLQGGIVEVVSDHSKDIEEQLDGNWLNPIGRRVLFAIGAELALQLEVNGTDAVFAYIFGPHAGKRLTDGT